MLERVYPAPSEWPAIRAFMAWQRGLPARVVANARPVRLDRGTLIVHVKSPVWAQELSLLAPSLLARIAAETGAAAVHALRFRVGPLPDVVPSFRATESHVKLPPPEPLPPELEQALSAIADEEVRESIAKAMSASLSRPR